MAVTLHSVCGKSAPVTRLHFHLVLPDDSGHPAWNVRDSVENCKGAAFTLRHLSSVEREIERVLGTPPIWVLWDEAWSAHDRKHPSPFDLLCFYVPALSEYENARTIIFLDDDVILQRSIFTAHRVAAQLKAHPLVASCQNWVWSSSSRGFVWTTPKTFEKTPHFGFRPVQFGRPLADTTLCDTLVESDEADCMSDDFSDLLDRAARDVTRGGERGIASDLQKRAAWNFGVAAIDVASWRKHNLTRLYHEWGRVAQAHQLFPTRSLALVGLGLAYVALRGQVSCWTDEVAVLRGLGYVKPREVTAAGLNIDDAFALKFNGDDRNLRESQYGHIWETHDRDLPHVLLEHGGRDRSERELEESGDLYWTSHSPTESLTQRPTTRNTVEPIGGVPISSPFTRPPYPCPLRVPAPKSTSPQFVVSDAVPAPLPSGVPSPGIVSFISVASADDNTGSRKLGETLDKDYCREFREYRMDLYVAPVLENYWSIANTTGNIIQSKVFCRNQTRAEATLPVDAAKSARVLAYIVWRCNVVQDSPKADITAAAAIASILEDNSAKFEEDVVARVKESTRESTLGTGHVLFYIQDPDYGFAGSFVDSSFAPTIAPSSGSSTLFDFKPTRDATVGSSTFSTTLPSIVPTMCKDQPQTSSPQLRTARFSNSGGWLELTLDNDSNRGGYGGRAFECGNLVAVRGSTVQCVFLRDDSIKVELDYTSSIIPGDVVTLFGGILLPKNALPCWVPANDSTAVLQFPIAPIVPDIKFQAPCVVGVCTALQIDISGSSGGGGRVFADIEWVVVASGAPAYISRLLDQKAADAAGVLELVVDVEIIESLVRYDLSVSATVTNFLGGTVSANLPAIRVISEPIPELFFVGGEPQHTQRPRLMSVVAMATLSSCVLSTNPDPVLRYTWNAASNDSAGSRFISSSRDVRKFELPSYSLSREASQLVVEANVTDSAGFSTQCDHIIDITKSRLVAAINGGDTRFASAGDVLVLDASASYDPDIGNSSNVASGLTYAWSCSREEDVENTCATFELADAPILSFNIPSGIYEFEVNVSSCDGRSSSAHTRVEVVDLPVPHFELLPVVATKIDPSKKLVFEAVVGPNDEECMIAWTLEDGALSESLALSEWTTTELSRVIKSEQETSIYLALLPGALVSGATYRFGLSAEFTETGHNGQATLIVTANLAPTSGYVAVDPKRGVTLQTKFRVKCFLWTDDPEDLPLTYTLSQAVSAGSGTESYLRLLSGSYSSTHDVFLSEGNADLNYSQTVVAYIEDYYGARATAFSDAMVFPLVDNATVFELAAVTNSLLDDALSRENVDEVAQIVTAASAATVSHGRCSKVSDAYCVSLNRDFCSGDQTCGPCLDGYDGASGDGNTQCTLIQEGCLDGTMNGNETDVDCGGGHCKSCPGGAACFDDTDCQSSVCSFYTCGIGIDGCSSTTCTGHGACTLQDYNGEPVADIRSCSTYTVTVGTKVVDACTVMCQCYVNETSGEPVWYGDACNLGKSEWVTTLELRDRMMSALVYVHKTQTPSVASLNQQASTLAALVDEGTLLTDQALVTAVDLVHSIAMGSIREGLAEGTVDSLASSLSGILGVTAARKKALSANFTRAIDSLTAALLAIAVPGEVAADVVTSNIIVVAQRVINPGGATLSLPRDSPDEPTPSVTFPSDFESAQFDAALIEYLDSVHISGSAVDSTIVRFTTTTDTYTMNSSGEFTFVLQHRTPIVIDEEIIANVTTVISCEPDAAELKVESNNSFCHGLDVSIIRDVACANLTRHHTVEVACSKQAGSCERWFANSTDWKTGACVPTSFTSTNTTCVCPSQTVIGVDSDYASSYNSASYLNYNSRAVTQPSQRSESKAKRPLYEFIGVMACVWFILAILGSFGDAQSRALLRSKGFFQLPHKLNSSTQLLGLLESKDVKNNNHKAFVAAALPSVVAISQRSRHRKAYNKTLLEGQRRFKIFTRMCDVLSKQHCLFSLYFVYDERKPRPLRCFILFFKAMIILVGEAAIIWYSFPAGLCQNEDTRDSCENAKGSYVFGTGQLCRWHETHEDCQFKGVTHDQGAMIRFQIVCMCVAVSLPLIKLVDFFSNNYVYVTVTSGNNSDSREQEVGEKGQPSLRALLRRRLSRRMSSDLDIVRCNSIDSLQSSDTGFSSFESDEDEDANFKVGHALLRNFRLNVTEALQSFSNLRRHSLTFAAAALVPTMSIVLQQRLELTDAIADIEARIKMRMMPGGDAARRGSDAEMNAIVQHVKVILAHHDAYWDLDPDAPDWHRKFATKVLGVLLESLRIAKMWNERLARFESEMNEAKVIRALYQLKVIEALELRGEQNLYIHEMKLQDRLEGHHGQSLETRTRDQKGAALFVALGACICAFLFLLQFGRVSGKSQMQLWVWGSVFSLVLILFVFESIRILMIWFYVPSLLIPRLSHIGDPLTMSVPRFRMTLAVQPADIVDSRLVLQVMRSPLVPDEVKQTFRQRFYHSQRMSSNQRQRYASMMSDLASTFEVVSDKTMWRKANEHYCLFGCDDSLSRLLDAAALVCECELDHQESDHRLVNRAYREANAKRWELAHLESVAHALRWRPPLSLNAQTFLTAMILNTSDDIQDLVIEEATNIAAFSFIYFIGRVSAGPTQFRHTIGASAVLLVAFIIVFLCCLWASRIALVPLAISAKKRVVRYCRRGNQPEIELSDSSETGDNESEKWSDDKSETSESDDEICVMESSSFDGATIHIEDEIQGSQKLILKSTFLSAISELNENGQAIDDDIWDVGDGYDSPTEDDDEILEKAPSRLEPSATVLWETPSDDVDESSVSTVSAGLSRPSPSLNQSDKNVRAFVPSRRCSNESNWYLESVMGYSVLRRLDTIEEEEEEEDDEDGDLMSVLGSDNSERRFDDDVHNVFQFEEEGEVVDDEALTLDPFWHDDDDVEEEDDGPPIQSSRMDSVSLPDDDGGAEDDDDCQPQSPRLDSCSCEDEDDGVVDDINQRTDSPLMMDFTLPNDDDCVEGDDDRQPQLRRRDSLLLDNDGAEGGVNWQAQRSSHSCLADDDGAEDGDCVEDDDAAKDEVDDDDDDSQPLSRHSDSCLSKDDDDADYDGDGDVDRQTQMPHLDSLDSSCSHNDGGVEADREPQSPRVDSLLLENHSTDKNLQARRSSHLDCYLPDDDGVEEDDEDWQPRSPRFESGGPDAENDEDSQVRRSSHLDSYLPDDDGVEEDEDWQPQVPHLNSLLPGDDGVEDDVDWRPQRSPHLDSYLPDDDGVEDDVDWRPAPSAKVELASFSFSSDRRRRSSSN